LVSSSINGLTSSNVWDAGSPTAESKTYYVGRYNDLSVAITFKGAVAGTGSLFFSNDPEDNAANCGFAEPAMKKFVTSYHTGSTPPSSYNQASGETTLQLFSVEDVKTNFVKFTWTKSSATSTGTFSGSVTFKG
jgi:hypothetical protein